MEIISCRRSIQRPKRTFLLVITSRYLARNHNISIIVHGNSETKEKNDFLQLSLNIFILNNFWQTNIEIHFTKKIFRIDNTYGIELLTGRSVTRGTSGLLIFIIYVNGLLRGNIEDVVLLENPTTSLLFPKDQVVNNVDFIKKRAGQ